MNHPIPATLELDVYEKQPVPYVADTKDPPEFEIITQTPERKFDTIPTEE